MDYAGGEFKSDVDLYKTKELSFKMPECGKNILGELAT